MESTFTQPTREWLRDHVYKFHKERWFTRRIKYSGEHNLKSYFSGKITASRRDMIVARKYAFICNQTWCPLVYGTLLIYCWGIHIFNIYNIFSSECSLFGQSAPFRSITAHTLVDNFKVGVYRVKKRRYLQTIAPLKYLKIQICLDPLKTSVICFMPPVRRHTISLNKSFFPW